MNVMAYIYHLGTHACQFLNNLDTVIGYFGVVVVPLIA